jgi:flagellar motility protein MotE (MotC chaperone)
LDRLIEQSPPIPTEAITLFEDKIGKIKDLKKPDICGALEHTRVFESSETRLKQMAVDAALMLRRKKQTLSELVTPEIESRIAAQIQTRLNEAIETRKKTLEDEIEEKHREVERVNRDYERVLEERKQKIKEEIELEKKLQQDHSLTPPQLSKTGSSQFESRLNYRKRSISHAKQELTEKALILHQKDLLLTPEEKNTIVIPKPEETVVNITSE